MKKTMIVLAAALAMSTTVQAAGVGAADGYVQGGFSDASGYDSDFAIKLGADFSKNLGGVKGLGLTAFYSHWSGEHSVFGAKSEVTANVLAAGPTFDLPLPNTKFTLQGRAFLMYSMVKAEACLPPGFGGGCASANDNELDLGIGIGGAYKLDDRMSIRIDYDMLDHADIITAGVGFKF
jgi:opacity protein-like surface antigen